MLVLLHQTLLAFPFLFAAGSDMMLSRNVEGHVSQRRQQQGWVAGSFRSAPLVPHSFMLKGELEPGLHQASCASICSSQCFWSYMFHVAYWSQRTNEWTDPK